MVNAIGRKRGLAATAMAGALLLVGLFGASGNAKAATVGDPVNVDFNYVGLNVSTPLGALSDLLLTPSTFNPPQALRLRGTYTNANGAFSVDKDTGLVFPELNLGLGPVALDAGIGLAENATGTYNEATGEMTLNPKIALSVGVDDVAGLPDAVKAVIGIQSGALGCRFSPIDIQLSTGNGWPAPGDAFAAGFTDGSVSGAFRSLPTAVATAGPPAACTTIGALLEPVGGLWLANKVTVSELPQPTSAKPCPLGQGFFQGACRSVCPTGFVGTPPDCVVPPKPVLSRGSVRAITVSAGKSATLKVPVANTGDGEATGVRVCVVAAPAKLGKGACATLGSVGAGASKTASVKFTAGKSGGSGSLSIRVTSTEEVSSTSTVKVTVKAKKKK